MAARVPAAHDARGDPRWRVAVAGVAVIAVVASGIWSQTRVAPIYLANVDNILAMQVQMGRWVAGHTPSGARIATNDVGAITYFGGRYCVDTVGLVSADRITQVLDYRKAHGFAHPDALLPSYLSQKRVDYCIIFPTWYPALARQPWMHRVGSIHYPNNTGGGDDLVVYEVTQQP